MTDRLTEREWQARERSLNIWTRRIAIACENAYGEGLDEEGWESVRAAVESIRDDIERKRG